MFADISIHPKGDGIAASRRPTDQYAAATTRTVDTIALPTCTNPVFRRALKTRDSMKWERVMTTKQKDCSSRKVCDFEEEHLQTKHARGVPAKTTQIIGHNSNKETALFEH